MRRKLRRLGPVEAAKRGVLAPEPDVLPIIRGKEPGNDWVCPQCGVVLVEAADPTFMVNAAFKCPRCGVVSTHEPPLQ